MLNLIFNKTLLSILSPVFVLLFIVHILPNTYKYYKTTKTKTDFYDLI